MFLTRFESLSLRMKGPIMENNPSFEIKQQLDRIADEVRTPIERLKHNDSETQARLLEVEQKLARRGGSDGGMGDMGGMGTSGVSALVTQDEGFLMVQSGRIKGTSINLPAGVFHAKSSPLINAGGIGGVQRVPGIFGPPAQRTTIRSLLNVVNTSAPSIEYVRESGFASGAAVVAEGALKPESVLDLTVQTAPVVTVATWVLASKQILSDMTQLTNYIDQRLRLAITIAEELQLLGGTGIAPNLLGLLVAGTPYVSPFTYATPTKLDVLRLACAQLQDSDFTPNGIVLHPNDMAAISLLKSTEGTYLAEPSSIGVPTLWGLPVVVTRSMPANTFMVADFMMAATLFDREATVLELGYANDDFLRNLVRLRVEERISLAIQMPTAVVHGAFA
jgi:hypothetical protein